MSCCRYMPCELLMDGRMSKAADVYSFAMLMCEMVTGSQLFQGLHQSQVESFLLFLHGLDCPRHQACSTARVQACFHALGFRIKPLTES